MPAKVQPTRSRRWTPESTTASDCTFQQMAPYIGRIKTSIAIDLLKAYTKPGDMVVDPFAGSGVIPFEAARLGRRTLAGDTNPYGVLLTRAKFSAPSTYDRAARKLNEQWDGAMRRHLTKQDLRTVPPWVRAFFHPETLRKALALRDALVESQSHFLFAALLGILHHQRPGFLSYPSSHLVPYLRDKLFPRAHYPDMYQERDVLTRMHAKLRRLYRRPPTRLTPSRIFQHDARTIPIAEPVAAIITSPPYMNELDYVRDNRLRLWFIDRQLPAVVDIPRGQAERLFRDLISSTFARLTPRLKEGGVVALVVGDVSRGRRRVDAARIVRDVLSNALFPSLRLEAEIRDTIPDIRRARRDLRGTKKETVLIYRRVAS